jgi:hypothetical protein
MPQVVPLPFAFDHPAADRRAAQEEPPAEGREKVGQDTGLGLRHQREDAPSGATRDANADRRRGAALRVQAGGAGGGRDPGAVAA